MNDHECNIIVIQGIVAKNTLSARFGGSGINYKSSYKRHFF